MDPATPEAKEFREYANAIRKFLQEMNEKYPRSIVLTFGSPEEQQQTQGWLSDVRPKYLSELDAIEEHLIKEHSNVDHFWKIDPAFNLAKRKVLRREFDRSSLYEAYVDYVVEMEREMKYGRIFFSMIRSRMEAPIKWQQALSLAIANYLDETSYRTVSRAQPTAHRIAQLLADLDAELEKPEAEHLFNLPGAPRIYSRTRKNLQEITHFLQQEDFQASLKVRKDKDLLSRITAREILIANEWAFGREKKSAAFILLGLSAFTPPIDLEIKTLERIWAKSEEQKLAGYGANSEARKQIRDNKNPIKCPFSDPRIPNPSL